MIQDNFKIRLSNTISWLRLPLIIAIIMLHCYSVVRLDGVASSAYFKFLYPFSLWIGETAVPAFFFISGFLFFASRKDYVQKVKTRISSLLVPYILWNSLLILLYISFLLLGYPQDICGKSIADYGIIDYLRLFWDRGTYDNGNFTPILCPLWYIRNLFLVTLSAPIFYYAIKYLRELFLVVTFAWWISTYHNAFIEQTIFFFSLGAYFPIHDKNPLRIVCSYPSLFFTISILLGMADILTHTLWSTSANLQIHRLAIITNIPVLLYLGDYFSNHGHTFSKLSQATFFIYCSHYPIVLFLRKACIGLLPQASAFTHIALYFACVILTTIICYALFRATRLFFPKFNNLLSGNR
ncbi:acyltransferase [Prevotella sp. E9-3]|uniref:acyltransferase family protein n=1 Tax=Prevotella sp. E9-3 TaxID=2913621 RepID=UPI001EDAF1C3|nr:acyltransferase family protein [Prevotella sp. E9-3]UKK49079.1 acyltransferase [Prevotella sp. E9-3]